VPLAGLTALQALRDELHLSPDQRVFIPGGAEGVGTFAIQIAKHLEAQVATTASPRGEALVKRLGADVVIDYSRERFEDKLSGYDCAFDLLGVRRSQGSNGLPGGRSRQGRGRPGDDLSRAYSRRPALPWAPVSRVQWEQ
jgi:NADPH:quinone reductase-like Zn-dependent oxidoreductase